MFCGLTENLALMDEKEHFHYVQGESGLLKASAAATCGQRLLSVKDSWKKQRGRIEREAKTKKLTRADRGAVRKMIMMT